MIAILPRSTERSWGTLSFASTLYLCPILDVLLENIPAMWHPELRLGLQEALVNAAKHGNQLNPEKQIHVRYTIFEDQHWWVISDQGSGFEAPSQTCDHRFTCQDWPESSSCQELSDCGRGLLILHQVFDIVEWVNRGTELWLCKHTQDHRRSPLIP